MINLKVSARAIAAISESYCNLVKELEIAGASEHEIKEILAHHQASRLLALTALRRLDNGNTERSC